MSGDKNNAAGLLEFEAFASQSNTVEPLKNRRVDIGFWPGRYINISTFSEPCCFEAVIQQMSEYGRRHVPTPNTMITSPLQWLSYLYAMIEKINGRRDYSRVVEEASRLAAPGQIFTLYVQHWIQAGKKRRKDRERRRQRQLRRAKKGARV